MQLTENFWDNLATIIVITLFVWYVGQLLLNIFWAHRSQTWPSTNGRIIKSFTTRGAYHYQFFAKVKYSYEVDGKQYIGKRVYFGVKGLSKSSVDEVLDNYPVNLKVIVYYHPKRPRLATLETELPFGTYLYLGGIFLVILIGICANAYSSFFAG